LLPAGAWAQSLCDGPYARGNCKQEEPAKPNKQPTPNERGTPERPAIIQIIPTEQEKAKAAQATEDEHQKARREWHLVTGTYAIATFTFLMMGGTVALALYTLRLWRTTRDLVRDAKTASDAALAASNESLALSRASHIATNRAWLKVKVSLSYGPLIFEQNGGVSFNVSFVITNVSNAPAINIHPHAWLVPIKGKGGWHWEEQQRRSKEVRATPVGGGFALFPNDEFPRNASIGQWSLGLNMTKEEVDAGIAANTQTHPPGYKKALGLYVVGFVDYTFPSDPMNHHQTGFILSLNRTAPQPIIPEAGQIPAAELILLEGGGMGVGHFAD
jgi:hypothetical protein